MTHASTDETRVDTAAESSPAPSPAVSYPLSTALATTIATLEHGDPNHGRGLVAQVKVEAVTLAKKRLADVP